MLRLILGKAGTGKTAAVIGEIRQAVEARQGGRLLLVPEQYSHEAERELCAACGDSLSLYAEVFSFTGLARRVRSRQGGAAATYLDKGGRLLCMALALDQVGSRLRVYSAARHRFELHGLLLQAMDELKSACVSPEMLETAALGFDDGLGDKLHDLALIAAAYDAVVARGHADPADRLTVLARQIEESDFGPDSHVYVDGFVDFTRQEQQVLSALLRRGVEMTVCMTLDDLRGESEIYALSRLASRRLLAEAKALGLETRIETLNRENRDPALAFYADNMFRYADVRWEGGSAPIRLCAAESLSAECEAAAARALELCRDEGCRWRDIAVAVRGFEDYRGTLESVFRQYGVPLFTARRSELLRKPLPALIAGVYEILDGGWDVDDVIGLLRTGLTGLGLEECDLLADYIYKWQLRGSAWEREGDWRQHPEGYGAEYDEAAREKLRQINALRRKLAGPLLRFRDRSGEAATAAGQAAALAELLTELHLPRQLERRSRELEESGRAELAGEYRQLWDIIVSALEQSAAILGDMELDRSGFGRLFTRMLAQYDVGLIPVALDRVSAGDFDRMRRRSIRHLIVLGCSDDRLPQGQDSAGVFSEEERQRLLERDIDLGAGEGELWREFALIYQCLTLPAESLTMSYPLSGADGEALRPALVFNRAAALFALDEVGAFQIAPALSLAAHALRGGAAAAAAAAEHFRAADPARFSHLEAAADMTRGRLSPAAVEALYGRHLRLSASRIDRFAACRFAYFCQYGLRARRYEPNGFHPPEIGTFMHYVLENTAREAKARGGFSALSDEQLHQLTDRFVQEYVHTELNDFQEKSSRFVHLFQRLTEDVHRVAADMAAELRRSAFEPLDFELDFAKAQDMRPLELGEGEESLQLTGIADRVDGWVYQGKLYLRVVDYKTGKKEFSLSDVWYGMGLQMLLYLFALEADGEPRYGMPVVPAGVMYVPARSAILSMEQNPDQEAVRKEHEKLLRRSGLVLADEAVQEAWERGEDKRYIPLKIGRGGKPTADTLASLEQLGLLAGHIRQTLTEMAKELRRGSIAADPYYRTQQENACLNCEFYDACHFADGENGERCRVMPKLSGNQVWGMLTEPREGDAT